MKLLRPTPLSCRTAQRLHPTAAEYPPPRRTLHNSWQLCLFSVKGLVVTIGPTFSYQMHRQHAYAGTHMSVVGGWDRVWGEWGTGFHETACLSKDRMAPPSSMAPGSVVTAPLASKPTSSATGRPARRASTSAKKAVADVAMSSTTGATPCTSTRRLCGYPLAGDACRDCRKPMG